jgi:hypothetical protein
MVTTSVVAPVSPPASFGAEDSAAIVIGVTIICETQQDHSRFSKITMCCQGRVSTVRERASPTTFIKVSANSLTFKRFDAIVPS